MRSSFERSSFTLAVVGAGVMGVGIAQIAARAGIPVLLHDARTGAAVAARERIVAGLQGLTSKGRIDPARAVAAAALIRPVETLADLAESSLVIEVIVERPNVPTTSGEARDHAHALFATSRAQVSIVRDSFGGVAQRVLATIVNIACEIAQQAIASPADIDRAVKLAFGYPHGPLEWGDLLGPKQILLCLERMHARTGDTATDRHPGCADAQSSRSR